MADNQEKINAPKVLRNLCLTVSDRLVHRHLTTLDYKYVKAVNQIVLLKKHEQHRLDIITMWFSSNHPWESTVFSNEKRFSLDGPNNWMTYVTRTTKYIRQRRQCHGIVLMLWLMTMPNVLLSFHSITGTFRSRQYIELLSHYVVPTMKISL